MEVKDKKILVLGLSKSGIAAAKCLAKRGAKVYITEGKEAKPEYLDKIDTLKAIGIKIETGGHSEEFISNAELAVTSPGIPPHSEIMQKLKAKNIPVISEIELAYLFTKVPFIAITGTNGKTTTTALTAHILSEVYSAVPCGNYGLPPCDMLDEDLDYFVCECSSFQLEYTRGFA